MKYIVYRGLDKEEIENCDSVAIILDNGDEVELQYRRSDGEVSLSVGRGSMVIEPRASNVVRIKVIR